VRALGDLHSQVAHGGEFWWHWGLSASLDIDGYGIPIVITDYPGPADPEGPFGFHSVDGNYRPWAVVFAGLCRDFGHPTTAIISHEMLEMLADQSTRAMNVVDLGDGTAMLLPLEVCDPCEGLHYQGPTGFALYDFVLPCWYVAAYQGQVDFLGRLPGPLRESDGNFTDVQLVTWSHSGPSGDDAARVIDAAAVAERNEVADAFASRAGVVDQLRARSTGARLRYPPPGPPSGRRGPAALERRKQPAKPRGPVTVVRREDIPVFVEAPPI
jgi:hypothetical protein